MIFRVQALDHAPRRSYRRIHPPLKNSIYTVGVKTISKTSFLRSMGSTKKSVSYGAWEAHFWVLQPLRSEIATCFSPFIPQRGVKNGKMRFPRCMRSKKKMFLTEHGKQIFHFCNPSRLILIFLGRFACLSVPFWEFSVQLDPHYSRRGWGLREFHNKLPQIRTRRPRPYNQKPVFSMFTVLYMLYMSLSPRYGSLFHAWSKMDVKCT